MREVEQVRVPGSGMFWVNTREEAETLALSLSNTLAWVTIRESYTAPNGFKWCVYFRDPYDSSRTS